MQFQKIFLLQKALQIGNDANIYAREQIPKGSNRLENLELSERYRIYLFGGLQDVRVSYEQAFQDKSFTNPLEGQAIARLGDMLYFSSKYSLGNCHELAIHAFFYIVSMSHSDIAAELYYVANGDHVFVVLNRVPNSHPNKPETWGKDAVICDPWLNNSFPAAEYRTQLNNYNSNGCKKVVNVFDSAKHRLAPLGVNTGLIRREITIQYLKMKFLLESKKFIEVVVTYKIKLESEKHRLTKCYGITNQKTNILEIKIKHLQNLIEEINEFIDKLMKKKYQDNYLYGKSELNNALKEIHKSVIDSMQFSKDDQKVLITHQGTDTKTEVMKFFNMRSSTRIALDELTKETNDHLARILKGDRKQITP